MEVELELVSYTAYEALMSSLRVTFEDGFPSVVSAADSKAPDVAVDASLLRGVLIAAE